MKILVVSFLIIFIISSSHGYDAENVVENSASEPIQPSSILPKRTTKRSPYGYGYGYSPLIYGDYYGSGYPYRTYYSSPYTIGYPYYGLHGGYGGYERYGW